MISISTANSTDFVEKFSIIKIFSWDCFVPQICICVKMLQSSAEKEAEMIQGGLREGTKAMSFRVMRIFEIQWPFQFLVKLDELMFTWKGKFYCFQ